MSVSAVLILIMCDCQYIEVHDNPFFNTHRAALWAYKMYRIENFVVGSLELDSVHLTECSILDPCYEICEKLC